MTGRRGTRQYHLPLLPSGPDGVGRPAIARFPITCSRPAPPLALQPAVSSRLEYSKEGRRFQPLHLANWRKRLAQEVRRGTTQALVKPSLKARRFSSWAASMVAAPPTRTL